ncbi:amidase domain-containing protein [Actinomadura chibensis]|nr:amidase domain-containing protein [Actinomadura chibensis]
MTRWAAITAVAGAAIAASLNGVPATAAPGEASTSAPAPVKTQLTELAQAYMQSRADQLTLRPTTKVQVSTRALTGALQRRRAWESARLAENRELLRREALDGGYSHAVTKVTPGKLAVTGNVATFNVSEFTTLYSLKVSEADRARGYDWESYRLPQTLTFRYVGDAWLLDTVTAPTGGVPVPVQVGDPQPVAEPQVTGTDDERPASTTRPSTGALTADVQPGEPQRQRSRPQNKHIIWYAEKYVYNYNRAYRRYDQDCTNFVSQALRHGGKKMVGSGAKNRRNDKMWFYGPTKKSTSFTWAAAANWGRFWSYRTLSLASVWSTIPSDVIQIDWDGGGKDHTTVVVGWKSNGDRLLNYHTNDRQHASLDKLLKTYPKARWYPRGVF